MESHSVSMLTVTLKLKSIHNIITHIYLHMHIVMYTSRVDSVRSVHTVPFFFSFFHFSSNCLNLSGFVFKAFCIRTCVCARVSQTEALQSESFGFLSASVSWTTNGKMVQNIS